MNKVLAQLKSPSLIIQVVAGMAVGIAIGHFFPEFGKSIKPLSDIFIHLIKMLIAPLLFATLVIGIAGTGGHGNLGRMGLRTIIYFEIATTVALGIGLGVANWLKPGAGMSLALAQGKSFLPAAEIKQGWDIVLHMFPTSVVQSMAEGDILQLVVFAVIFALALAAAGNKGKPVMTLLESLAEVMFKFVNIVMRFAPIGVLGAMAGTVGESGLGVLMIYAKLVGSLYLALILFVLAVLITVCTTFRIPFLKLVKAVKEPFVLAFSTASSEAALPKAMQAMERFGVPKSVVSFVLPTGYTFNLDGSTLYLSLAALCVAQMAGIEMSWQQQLLMMGTLMLTSKGVAAVPRASLVVLAGTLAAFHLPIEGIAVILGIDHVLDMGRTSVNLLGNCVASAVVARWEGVLDDEKMEVFGTDAAGPEPDEKAESDIKRIPATV